MKHLRTRLAERRCNIDASKTSMWGPRVPDTRCLEPLGDPLSGIQIIPFEASSGIQVLGAPIPRPGTTQFTRDKADSVVAQNERACRLVSLFPDTQIQHCLLRFCLDACRVNYLLRVCPFGPLQDIWTRSDNVLRSTLVSILGSTISDPQWTQATLSLNQGGLGLRTASFSVGPARIAALHNWYLHAEDQMGLKHTKFGDIPALLLLLPPRDKTHHLFVFSQNFGVSD